MTLDQFINTLQTNPEEVSFEDTMAVIHNNYDYSQTQFSNGSGASPLINEAGSNEGSCKIFAFAKLNNLNIEETLHCFGDFYRVDVLKKPHNNDHQNIRNFMLHGWEGIRFSGQALKLKASSCGVNQCLTP